jgi:hypothetical protein
MKRHYKITQNHLMHTVGQYLLAEFYVPHSLSVFTVTLLLIISTSNKNKRLKVLETSRFPFLLL